jgi:hypothetical protein
MAKRGRRYHLLIYSRTLNRWWPLTLGLGFTLLALVSLLWLAEWYFINPADNPFPHLDTTTGIYLLGTGGVVLGFTFFLLVIRTAAYVQPRENHLRLVTPFLRMNVSYKRVRRAYTAEVHSLFPPKKFSGVRREIIAPLAVRTAIVLELTGLPSSQSALRLFLSPFFFKDRTPHLVILVRDWLNFSTELESLRDRWQQAQTQGLRRQPGLLSHLPGSRK